jgi:hypothetical protein
MDLWDANKLVLFIAFVVPGFVSLKAYELLVPRVAKDSAQQLIDAVAYSSINYALLLWPIYEIEIHGVRSTHPTAYVGFYVFVLLGAPIFWACLLRWARTTQFVQQSLPHPTARPWDYLFSKRKPYWIIVTLKDGKKIGGRYDSRSFASSAPASEQLYLEECWAVNDDGGFERRREQSAGILILATDIVTVELFNVIEEQAHDGTEEDRRRLSATDQGVSASDA